MAKLIRVRLNYESIILDDFEYAQREEVELRLWNAHLKVNSWFRKHLKAFREASGKRKPVERRKAEKHYLDFIKSSQRFYRGYIQRLASQFGGIKELDEVARRLNLSTLSINEKATPAEQLHHNLLLSCHRTLAQLGDLSRYRETELSKNERNWGPAIGYYDLATAIYPPSGSSHNQLAVIAREDDNHLRVLYHLYRALAAEEPHPGARRNLETEFKRTDLAWKKGELVSDSWGKGGQSPEKSLVGWFVRLHARCYRGIEFEGHDEMEEEVLSHLAIALKERPLGGILNKVVLINISAGDMAVSRYSGWCHDLFSQSFGH